MSNHQHDEAQSSTKTVRMSLLPALGIAMAVRTGRKGIKAVRSAPDTEHAKAEYASTMGQLEDIQQAVGRYRALLDSAVALNPALSDVPTPRWPEGRTMRLLAAIERDEPDIFSAIVENADHLGELMGVTIAPFDTVAQARAKGNDMLEHLSASQQGLRKTMQRLLGKLDTCRARDVFPTAAAIGKLADSTTPSPRHAA